MPSRGGQGSAVVEKWAYMIVLVLIGRPKKPIKNKRIELELIRRRRAAGERNKI